MAKQAYLSWKVSAALQIFGSWAGSLLILLATIWIIALHQIDEREDRFRLRAIDALGIEAGQLASEVGETVRDADNLLLLIKDEIDSGRDISRFDVYLKSVLGSKAARVFVVDAAGKPMARSMPGEAGRLPPSLYLQGLAQEPGLGMRIDHGIVSTAQGNVRMLAFSRRLNGIDGKFAGAVVIELSAEDLAANESDVSLRYATLVLLRTPDGVDLHAMSKLPGALNMRSPERLHADRLRSASELFEGSAFTDGRARFIAWQRIDRYPLVVLASVPEQVALDQHRSQGHVETLGAMALSALLTVGAALGATLQWRRHTRRKKVRAIQKSFRQAVEGTMEALYMVRPLYGEHGAVRDFLIEDCNEQAARRMHLKREDMLGHTLRELMAHEDNLRMHAFLLRILAEGLVEDEIEIGWHDRHQSGVAPAGWIQRRGVKTEAGIAVTVRDVTESRSQQEALARMAVTDALTGLPNRRWLVDHLPAILRASGEGRRKVALLFIDLDNFKVVNDTLGHEVGDRVLTDVTACLKSTVRLYDTVVRLGGDEFTVVVEDVDSTRDVEERAARVVAAVNRLNQTASWGAFAVTASVGIAVFPDHTSDAQVLLQYADIAMYSAKAAGKAQYRMFSAEHAMELQRRVQLQQDLQKAVGTYQLQLHYQPRVDAFTGKLTGLESLLRWHHPENGLVLPNEFIPLAEERGLIIEVGEWAFELLCRQIRAWQDQGLDCRRVSFNVSEMQVRSERFRDYLTDCLARHGLTTDHIALELTESAISSDDEVLVNELEKLHDMGLRIEIDDFGTGHSSLSRLRRLAVDVLKIDQSFVHTLGQDLKGDALCSAIHSIGQALGIVIVAEGVETAEQLERLRQFGSDEVQGYLISRPMPASALSPMLQGQPLFEPVPRTLMRLKRP